MTEKPADIVIGAIDVGSPKTGKLGWAIIDSNERYTGRDLDEFIDLFSRLAANKPASLGFEAPMFIPCHTKPRLLTSQRPGENGKPWSAGAGATVTTIGLAIMTYTLTKLRERLTDKTATLDWLEWPNGSEFLLFEAFVSGANHAGPDEHWKDALTAAVGFQNAMPDLDRANAVICESVLSLVGACLIRTGWCEPSATLLSQSCLVIRPDALAEV